MRFTSSGAWTASENNLAGAVAGADSGGPLQHCGGANLERLVSRLRDAEIRGRPPGLAGRPDLHG